MHRYRKNNLRQSLEAKILFDADKLENLYSNFYTEKATAIAKKRQHIAIQFYNSLYQRGKFVVSEWNKFIWYSKTIFVLVCA